MKILDFRILIGYQKSLVKNLLAKSAWMQKNVKLDCLILDMIMDKLGRGFWGKGKLNTIKN
jgi:hypothetical protein